MKQFSKDLGNVALAPRGKWSKEQEYEKLNLVYNDCDNLSYVAKIDVPIGVEIDNREYWQPMNATGYADNNFINLTTESETGTVTAYESLEEAVATILPINRRAGATLSFFNLNADRLDRQAEFELWQFNSTDLANWENRDYWNNIYYNWNVFAGWYVGADGLKNHVKIPNVGQYAYVGTNLNDALLYQCRTNGTWTNTGIKVRNYISVVVSGNITIGDNGNWFSDGKDTGIAATPAVDEQLDNIIMRLQQHDTEISNLKKSNANLQDKITSNDSDITSLNAKHESLSKTVQGIAATGGASTATNVTYDNDTSGLNAENAQDAIDELQVSKLDKVSVVQESGEAEDKVMSQKVVSDKLSDLSGEIININDNINNKLTNIEYIDGAFIKMTDKVLNISSPQPSNYWRYAILDCQEGDVFFISGRSTNNKTAPIWSFVNDTGKVIEQVYTYGNLDLNKIVITAPALSTKLVLNDNKSDKTSYMGKPLYLDIEELKSYAPVVEIANSRTMQNSLFINAHIDDYVHYGDIAGGVWSHVEDKTFRTFVFPVFQNDVIKFKTRSTSGILIAFLSDFNGTKDKETIHNIKPVEVVNIKTEKEYIIDSATKYIAIRYSSLEAGDCFPWLFSINGYSLILNTSDKVDILFNKKDFFYINKLEFGYYYNNQGDMKSTSNPDNSPYNGTEVIKVNEKDKLEVDAIYYILFDSNMDAISKLIKIDGIIEIPEQAAYIAFNTAPNKEETLLYVRKIANGYNQIILPLLEYGKYWNSTGQLVKGTPPAWRGSEKLQVKEKEHWKVFGASYYIVYNNDVAITKLIAVPESKIIKIPKNATHMAFDVTPVEGDKNITVTNISNGSDNYHTQWRNKKWVAFGCSITDTGKDDNGNSNTGKYAPYLVGLSGLRHFNWAWGGSCLGNRSYNNSDGKHPTYLQRIDAAAKAGVLSDADIITIDGLYNDYNARVPIGELTDKTDDADNDSTIYMSLYQAITKLKTAAPNALVVFLTDNTGQEYNGTNYSTQDKPNGIGLYQKDYWNALINYAQFMGVVCIESGQLSQINYLHPEYLADHIHQSELGGKQFANAIWSVLKNIQPNIREDVN